MNWRDAIFKAGDDVPASWANWVTTLLSNIVPGNQYLGVETDSDKIIITPFPRGQNDVFQPIAFEGYPIEVAGTEKVRVGGGRVHTPDGVQSISAKDFTLATATWVYVELSGTAHATNGIAWTVTSTLQNNSTEPTFWSEAAGTITVKIKIGQVSSSKWFAKHVGDVFWAGFDETVLRGVKDYDGTKKQVLYHDASGNLKWLEVDEC